MARASSGTSSTRGGCLGSTGRASSATSFGLIHSETTGVLTANGQTLSGGDALLMEKETTLSLTDGHDAEVLVFDLAA